MRKSGFLEVHRQSYRDLCNDMKKTSGKSKVGVLSEEN